MKLKNIISVLLYFFLMATSNLGYSQTAKAVYEQIEFKEFSETCTKSGVEEFWTEMYVDFHFKERARDSMVRGVVNVFLKFNNDGEYEIYYDEHLGHGVNKELERVLHKNLNQVKMNTKNIITTARIGFCEMDDLKNHEFEDCHLIFTYVGRNQFTRY